MDLRIDPFIAAPRPAGPQPRDGLRRALPLSDLPPDGLAELLSESEARGSRIVHRLVDEWHSGANRFDRPGEALFGAWVDGRLVGVCGLNVDPYAGDARIGRVRHLYVLSAFRRQGVGRRLTERVVQAAHGRFDDLRLRTNDRAAVRLYEVLGFRPSGGAADHTHAMPLAASSTPGGHR
jgi:GNAT superfamily N-acetyltransferase